MSTPRAPRLGLQPPPLSRVVPDRIFYGWWIAGGCLVLMIVSHGVGFYGPAVLLRPLQEEHGWSNAAVSGATGTYFAVAGLTAAVLGPRIDRHGPVLFMVLGGVAMGAVFALVGFVESLWQLYAVYVLVAAVWGAFALVTVNVLITRWFVRHRAQALGTAFCGVSIGGILVGPGAAMLLETGGVRLAAPVLGAVVVLVAVPVAALVFAESPSVLGLGTDGDPVAASSDLRPDDTPSPVRWSAGSVGRVAPFWLVLAGFVLVLLAQTGFLVHQLSFLEDRFGDRGAASLALSLTAFGTILARLVIGPITRRVDLIRFAIAVVGLQIASVSVVTVIDGRAVTYVAVLAFGFTVGNVYLLQTLIVADRFGAASFATVFGLVNLATSIATGFGPALVGGVEQGAGYAVAFGVLVVCNAGALVVLAALRRFPAPVLSLTGENAITYRDR